MSQPIILDGKKLSEKILDGIKEKISQMPKKPRLAVVLVGENPVSLKYIKQKENACKKIGADFILYNFPESVTSKKLREELNNIIKSPLNTGIIIQLPLPQHVNKQYILDAVPHQKDVDVLSSSSLGKFYTGKSGIISPTTGGIARLLEEYKIEMKGKIVVIVGAGSLVGKPFGILALQRGATVVLCNEFTKNIADFTKKADILISATGKPDLISGKMIKKGVVLVDAGFSTVDNTIKGDINFESASKKSSYITPVPGGVGPMTVAFLLCNLIKLNQSNKLNV